MTAVATVLPAMGGLKGLEPQFILTALAQLVATVLPAMGGLKVVALGLRLKLWSKRCCNRPPSNGRVERESEERQPLPTYLELQPSSQQWEG
nr:hypothetical protein [Dendronalium sp. ChiSLP03b]MDZ8206835.1 hypothetical protein [Dendronalium sp. ChiSLP03b]